MRAWDPGIRAAPGCRHWDGAQGSPCFWLCARPRQSLLRVCSWEAGSRDAEPSVCPEGSCSVEGGSCGHSCWPGAQPRCGSPARGWGAGVLPVVLTHGAVRGLGTGAFARGRQKFPDIPEADRPEPGGAGCASVGQAGGVGSLLGFREEGADPAYSLLLCALSSGCSAGTQPQGPGATPGGDSVASTQENPGTPRCLVLSTGSSRLGQRGLRGHRPPRASPE